MFLRQAASNFLMRLRLPPQILSATRGITINSSPFSLSSKNDVFYQYGSRGCGWRAFRRDRLLLIVSGQAALMLGIYANPVLAEDDASVKSSIENVTGGTDVIGLRKIEDGSVVSNIHTSKWRVFTDTARDLFLRGRLDKAEKLFLSALQEAKEGFGERDAHVASACNNLAELYRVKKEFDKAEPLYLEAINILDETYGPEDIRVGSALHNLGQFYLMQQKLREARLCYERALKIKGRVLGHDHTDYADTMYHLGKVLYLEGNEKDSEDLVQDSIRILEAAGQGESIRCIMRLRYLTQIYLKSNRLRVAENVQRKILHIIELSKGWNSLDTVIAAEELALTLQSAGNLREAQELLERCLDSRKKLFPEDHIQIGANMLHLARVAMLNSNRLRKITISEAIVELDRAKDLLGNSIRIARRFLYKLLKQRGREQNHVAFGESVKEGQAALIILLQSLDALGLLKITKLELQEAMGEQSPVEAENALLQCISAFKEFGIERLISDSPEVKAEYLSCLKHLLSLIIDPTTNGSQESKRVEELLDEIKRVEAEILSYRKRNSLESGSC